LGTNFAIPNLGLHDNAVIFSACPLKEEELSLSKAAVFVCGIKQPASLGPFWPLIQSVVMTGHFDRFNDESGGGS
jgi:hypothetical protein